MSMIYQLHEMQHAVMSPWRRWAEMNQQIFGSPFSLLSYVPVSKKIAAACELMLRVTNRYEKPEFGLNETQVDDKKVAVTEEITDTLPFCRLLHFKRDTGREDPRLLVVAPLSGHYATLLRDTVRALLPNHDVYVTDWANARAVSLAEGPFHFDDYVAHENTFIPPL